MSVYDIRASEVAALAGLHDCRDQQNDIEAFLCRVDPVRFAYERQVQSGAGLPHATEIERLLNKPRIRSVAEEAQKLKPKSVEELANKKKKLRENLSILDELTPRQRRRVSGVLHGDANKAFGTEMEQCVREKIQQEYHMLIFPPNIMRKSFFKIGDNFFDIVGRADGIVVENHHQCILEIKTRTKRLFWSVRDYDEIQVQAYCFLYDCKFGYLVEALKTEDQLETRLDIITRNEACWNDIKENVKAALEPYFSEME